MSSGVVVVCMQLVYGMCMWVQVHTRLQKSPIKETIFYKETYNSKRAL